MRKIGRFFLFFCLNLGVVQAAENAPPPSPRLTALQASLQRHDPDALRNFWAEIDQEHTPMVEPILGDAHDQLVTFLIRADPSDESLTVRLGSDFPMRTANRSDPYQRLGDSNVWFTSYVLPKDAIIAYRLRVPQGLTRSPNSVVQFNFDGVQLEHFLDPLNPRKFPPGDAHVDAPLSYYLGPDAPQNPYLKPVQPSRAGTVQEFDVASAALKGKRKVSVYMPAGRKVSALPLLLLFDAGTYLTDLSTRVMLDNMIDQHVIPAVLVAFVESGEHRNEDLAPNPDYQKFIVTDLMPWLQAHFNISRDRRQHIVGGLSLGGLAAAYTAFSHPELFANVLSQSGSYWWSDDYLRVALPSPNAGWMVRQFAEAPRKQIRFYCSVGVWEGAGMLSNTRTLRSVLLGKGYELTYREITAGHSGANFQATFPGGMIALLGKR
jgi:enterochelin esterase-like enzyme